MKYMTKYVEKGVIFIVYRYFGDKGYLMGIFKLKKVCID